MTFKKRISSLILLYLCVGLSGSVHAEGLLSREAIIDLTQSSSPIAKKVMGDLELQTKNILANAARFETPSTGCDLQVYLNNFSTKPAGAAPAVAVLATYALAVQIGHGWGNPGLADEARTTANQIIANWSEGGFRYEGQPITEPDTFCAFEGLNKGQIDFLVALQVGRGMIYWAQALDLLGTGLSPVSRAFVERQKSLVIKSALIHVGDKLECQRYDNQTSNELLSIAMMANVLGDQQTMLAVIGKNKKLGPLTLEAEINGTIYGDNDKPKKCYDTARSETYFQVGSVSKGEIVDRFRAKPYQTFGYTLGSLRQLMMLVKLYKNNGYDLKHIKGAHGQTIEDAINYYGQFVERYLSMDKVSIPESETGIADFGQYAGKEFTRGNGASIQNKDDMLTPFLLAARIYGSNATAHAVIDKAKSFRGVVPFSGTDILNIDDVDPAIR